MSAASATCPNCGAAIRRRTDRFCEFCGTELAGAPVDPGEAAAAGRRARLAELAESELYRRALAEPPEPPARVGGTVVRVVFALVFCGVALFIAFSAAAVGVGFFALFPFLFVGAGVWMIARALRDQAAYRDAPLESRPAVVVDERSHVRSSGDHTRTSYHATLELHGGERREFRIDGATAGQLAPGDAGVAFVKGPHLVAFWVDR